MNYEELDKLMFEAPPADGVYSMDNLQLYGKVCTNHPYPEMVRRSKVVDTRVHLIQTDDSLWDLLDSDDEIRLRDDETGEEIVLTSEGQKAQAIAMIAVRGWIDLAIEAGIAKKILPFFNRIVDCERAIDPTHPLSLIRGDRHGIHCEVFHSGLSNKQRRRSRDKFAAHPGPAMMPSVRAIREGINITSADTGIALRGYGLNEEGVSAELQQHHGRLVRKDYDKDAANWVVPIPPIGHADQIRRNILRMMRDLLEALGKLEDIIQILAKGGAITGGTLRERNIYIHPSTPLAINEVAKAVRFTVMEYLRDFNQPLYNKLTEAEFDEFVDSILG